MEKHLIGPARSGLQKIFPALGTDDEARRRELILNVLLIISIIAFIVLNGIRLADVLTRPADDGLPLVATFTILAFFLGLFGLSRRGWTKTAAWLLVLVYSLPMFYCVLNWGTDLPAAILLAVLTITLSGVLISDNMVLASTALIGLAMIGTSYLQEAGLINIDSSWHSQAREAGDALTNAVLIAIVAVIAWFFARGISRALARARRSEADLRLERDSLEIKVQERTQQLRQAEAEKISQLYRFAEFGRLSSGLFHDLVNPLTAVSLNLEQIKSDADASVAGAKSCLQQALLATHKMEGLVAGIKKQIRRENKSERFSANEEVRQILEILAYKARCARTRLDLHAGEEISLHGDAVKFGQIVINLVANAIEAGENDGPEEKTVRISLRSETDRVIITVADHGAGISPDNLDKIFAPFFSTKSAPGCGLGLGLASTKSIVEKDFGGDIRVASEPGQGSEFTVSLPLHKI